MRGCGEGQFIPASSGNGGSQPTAPDVTVTWVGMGAIGFTAVLASVVPLRHAMLVDPAVDAARGI